METLFQPAITGYRQLNAEEAAAMNAVKAIGIQLEALVNQLKSVPTNDQRWIAIGQTDLQKGLMALTRAIAQPTTF